MVTRLAVNGATGRMGAAVREAAAERDDISAVLGIAPGGDGDSTVVTPGERRDELAAHDVDAVVDFSVAGAVSSLAEDCVATGTALVTGTTGLDAADREGLGSASGEVPVLHARNFSRGIVALRDALDAALDVVGAYDIEISETHHREKRDAPSGTATALLETVADHREVDPVHGRDGTHLREETEVGVHSRRAGHVHGEHEILLADNDEALTLGHRAEDRGVFAAGALDAAAWLADRDPGRYTVDDAFGQPTHDIQQ